MECKVYVIAFICDRDLERTLIEILKLQPTSNTLQSFVEVLGSQVDTKRSIFNSNKKLAHS